MRLKTAGTAPLGDTILILGKEFAIFVSVVRNLVQFLVLRLVKLVLTRFNSLKASTANHALKASLLIVLIKMLAKSVTSESTAWKRVLLAAMNAREESTVIQRQSLEIRPTLLVNFARKANTTCKEARILRAAANNVQRDTGVAQVEQPRTAHVKLACMECTVRKRDQY
jgi:hypothetical protein